MNNTSLPEPTLEEAVQQSTVPSPAAQRAATRIVTGATTTPEPAGLLTVPEMMAWLRVSRKTLYDYVRLSKIPAIKLGRRVLFHRPSVESALLRMQRGGQ